MRKTICLCGAKLKLGGTCKIKVRQAGTRCHHHAVRLSPRRAVELSWKVAEKAAAAYGMYETFPKLYNKILELVQVLGGSLMPEDFWQAGFAQRNPKRMQAELRRAKSEKISSLISRYSCYPPKLQLRVTQTYSTIDELLQSIPKSAA